MRGQKSPYDFLSDLLLVRKDRKSRAMPTKEPRPPTVLARGGEQASEPTSGPGPRSAHDFFSDLLTAGRQGPGLTWRDRPRALAIIAGGIVAVLIVCLVTVQIGFRKTGAPGPARASTLGKPTALPNLAAASPAVSPSASPVASPTASPGVGGAGGFGGSQTGGQRGQSGGAVVAMISAATPYGVAAGAATVVVSVNTANGNLEASTQTTAGGAWTTQDVTAAAGTPTVATGNAPASIYHNGVTSVFTVSAASGHLWETYRATGAWAARDLTASAGVPTVVAADSPTATLHSGEVSVFTANASNHHLQETYLASLGAAWASRDIGASAGTPAVSATISPVSVFQGVETKVLTIDPATGHLWETWLTSLGATWQSDDLSASYGTPNVRSPNGVAAVVHNSETSVFTVSSANGHLQETYQPQPGGGWATRDLTSAAGTPAVAGSVSPSAVFQSADTKVFTVNASNGHLVETWLSRLGAAWQSDDLSGTYGTPAVASPGVLGSVAHNGGTSAYSVNASNRHLEETYQSAPGQHWVTTDMLG